MMFSLQHSDRMSREQLAIINAGCESRYLEAMRRD